MPRLAKNICSILGLSLLTFHLPLVSRAETPPLLESEPIVVPGTKGRFDYLKVDEQLHRLLADHTGNGTLDVFDLPDGKLLQTVPIGAVQDVSIDQEHGKYYVTVSDPRNLTIVDRQTLKVEETADGLKSLGTIQTPPGTHTLAVDPDTHDVWIAYAKENASFIRRLSVPR